MLLLPVYVLGPVDDLASFKDRLYADPELELRASDRTRHVLIEQFGLSKGALDAATYVPDAFLDELIETMNRVHQPGADHRRAVRALDPPVQFRPSTGVCR